MSGVFTFNRFGAVINYLRHCLRYLWHYLRCLSWRKIPLRKRDQLPKKPGLYAIVSMGRIVYLGKSKDIYQRWNAKGGRRHHRLDQALDLVWPRLHYVTMQESAIHDAEKAWIKRLGKPPWNYSKVQKHKWQFLEVFGVGLMAALVFRMVWMLGSLIFGA